MKFKADFVTNSSSASFSIFKEVLSPVQIILIYNHIEVAKGYDKKEYRDGFDESDQWLIYEDKNKLHGSTTMDNFDMKYFLEKIGVHVDDIDYDGSN